MRRQRKRTQKSEIKKLEGLKTLSIKGGAKAVGLWYNSSISFYMMSDVLQMYFSATGRHNVQ